MTNLYNRCIENSNWPAIWKRGELTPIFKKGDKHNVENYRPITTLSIIDNVFESLLSKQITHYFDPTSPRLTAYRKNHSCETTLARLTEDWKHAIDSKELVTILSTDMSKAFDSLCHNLVIKKLKAYGFTNQSLDLRDGPLETLWGGRGIFEPQEFFFVIKFLVWIFFRP